MILKTTILTLMMALIMGATVACSSGEVTPTVEPAAASTTPQAKAVSA